MLILQLPCPFTMEFSICLRQLDKSVGCSSALAQRGQWYGAAGEDIKCSEVHSLYFMLWRSPGGAGVSTGPGADAAGGANDIELLPRHLQFTVPGPWRHAVSSGPQPGHQLLRVRDAALALAVVVSGAQVAHGTPPNPVEAFSMPDMWRRQLPCHVRCISS
jgi:hypothetical protein